MYVNRYKLYDFSEQWRPVFSIEVPQDAELWEFKVLQDGVYAIYVQPKVKLNARLDRFHIAKGTEDIPANCKKIQILDAIVDTTTEARNPDGTVIVNKETNEPVMLPTQVIVFYPIFQYMDEQILETEPIIKRDPSIMQAIKGEKKVTNKDKEEPPKTE